MAQVYVVIPCHREPIAEVERSLASALAVPIDGIRAVIVDDGIGRGDLDALASDRVTVLHRAENGGPSAALDDGITSTPVGSVICRLDVRDEFYPDPKARQIETVLRGVRASCSPHWDPVRDFIHVPPPDWRKRIYSDSCFTGVTTVYWRDVWEQVGIDTSIRWAEDWRFSMLIEHVVGFDLFPEVTCSAGMFAGGHTDCVGNRAKYDKREADRARVVELGRALSHPDAYAHLYNERWCAKRGIAPLPRRLRR
jgi:glycosyltransferase involved in cell wall biosynthesis